MLWPMPLAVTVGGVDPEPLAGTVDGVALVLLVLAANVDGVSP